MDEQLAETIEDEFEKAFKAHDNGAVTRRERDGMIARAARAVFTELAYPHTTND